MTAVPKLEDLSDQELIERIRAGARDDFEILVRRHNQRLYRAARAIMKADDEAEDIVQQAWLEVFRNLAQFRGDAAFTTWATRIAVNAAINHARKRPIVAEVAETVAADKPDEEVERAELG